MKKLLMILVCVALMMGSALAEAAPGSPMEAYGPAAVGEKLGFDLLSMLHVTGENTILSSQSLALALGMAAEGAEGNTLSEILSVLAADNVSDIAADLPEGMQSANAVFTAPGLALRQDYIKALNERYLAEWFELDGDVVGKVNAWVEDKTNGLIEELLSETPAANTGAILLNALAMDADWVSPFMPESTVEDVFHAPEGDETVQMMNQKEYFDYAEKDGMQIIRLPYVQGALEMWIVLPPEGGMFQLLEILANEGMFYLESDAERREVVLSLPKMDISDENTLSEALQMLGVETAFSANADFSAMSDVPMCIDDVVQKVRVQVDEQGTRAAAATAIAMRCMGMMPTEEPVEMIVNRPFVFVISDSETGSVYFAGAVDNPNG